jgi:cytochrome c oxidase subunit 3
MASVLLPPPPVAPAPEKETPVADHNNGNGFGGGNFDEPNDGPNYGPDWQPDPDFKSERWSTPASAYRTAILFTVFSILSLFATLTHILESRWVHSKDWVSISLPPILFVDTAILLVSSITVELARQSLRTNSRKGCTRWLCATLVLGLGFVAGQLVAWRELDSKGLYVASNPGSFFFYLITAAHGIHLLGGILALTYIILVGRNLADASKRETAVGSFAIYWHFMGGLWVYLLALLFMTIQQ